MTVDEFVKNAGEWNGPDHLAQLVSEIQAQTTREDFFKDPKFQPVKDAWQAAALARGYAHLSGKEVEVRLSSQDRFPDFQIRIGGEVFDFESVMVVVRPLGMEYKGDRGLGPATKEIPESLPEFDIGPLEKVVRKKAGKHYQGVVNLLVYVNAKGGRANHKLLAEAVRTVAGESFDSIWMIGLGRESGDLSALPANFLGCAKASDKLAKCDDWLMLPPGET